MHRCEREAEQIAKAAREMGLDPQVEHSSLSEAAYVGVYGEDDLADLHLKIRVAEHEARPTYQIINGAEDFSVGAQVRRDGSVISHLQDSDGDWLDAVAYIAEKSGRPMPDRIIRLRARRLAAIKSRRATIDEQARRHAAETASAQANYKAAVARLPEPHKSKWTYYETLSGKSRKNARKSGWYKAAVAALDALIAEAKS